MGVKKWALKHFQGKYRKHFVAPLKILIVHTFSQQRPLPEMYITTILTHVNIYVGLELIVVVKIWKQPKMLNKSASWDHLSNKPLALTSLLKDSCLEAPKLRVLAQWFISLFHSGRLTVILPNYCLSFFTWDAERQAASCYLTDILQIINM